MHQSESAARPLEDVVDVRQRVPYETIPVVSREPVTRSGNDEGVQPQKQCFLRVIGWKSKLWARLQTVLIAYRSAF